MADDTKSDSTSTAKAPAADAKKIEFPKKGVVPSINEESYKTLISTHGSDILVVNYWATWCGPCVEELPHFVAVSKQNPESRVRFVGLSLDMPKQVDSVVVPFLEKKGIPYANFLLDADDPDVFIGMVSEDWTGAIPATIIYDRAGNKISEHLTELSETELTKAIEDAKAKVPASAPASAPDDAAKAAAPAAPASGEVKAGE